MSGQTHKAHVGHTRRSFLRAAGATGAAVIAPQLLPASLGQTASCTRPNLVFFLGEGARWDESSLAGNTLLKTPNIDRIGREGAEFTQASAAENGERLQRGRDSEARQLR